MSQILDKDTGLMVDKEKIDLPGTIKPMKGLISGIAYDPSGQPLTTSDWDRIKDPIINTGGYEDLRTIRKDTQSIPAAILNGAVTAIGSVPFKFGQMATALGGLTKWGIKGAFDDDYEYNFKTFSDVYNNSLMNSLIEGEEQFKNNFPILYDKNYESDNVFDRLGTAKFWAGDGFDGLAFLASAYFGGAIGNYAGRAIGGVLSKGLGAIGASSFNVGGDLAGFILKGTGEVGARAHSLTNGLGMAGSTFINTIGEAAIESHDTYKQVYDLALEVYGDPERAKDLASKAGAGTFGLNSLILLGPNLFQSKLFFKTFKSSTSVLQDVAAGTISSKGYSLGKEALKKAGTGLVMEGLWEEGIQNAMQNYEKKKAFGMYGDGVGDIVSGLSKEWLRGWSTQEGQNSMIIGSIIGALGGGVGGYTSAKHELAGIKNAEKNLSEIQKISKLADGVLPSYLAKKYKTNAEGKFEFTEQGELIPNEEFINERTKDLLNDLDYENTKTIARLHNDSIQESVLDGFYYSRKLYNYLANPIYKNSEQAYEAMISSLEGDLNILFDMETPEGKEQSKKFNESIKPQLNNLKLTFEKVNKQFKPVYTKDSSLDPVVNDKLKKMIYYMASRSEIMKNTLSENTNLSETAKKELGEMVDESDRLVKELSSNSETRKKYVDDYVTNRNYLIEAQEKIKKIDEELNKKEKKEDGTEVLTVTDERKKELEKEKDKIGYDFMKDRYINGNVELDRLAPELAMTDTATTEKLNFNSVRGSKLKVTEKVGKLEDFRIHADKTIDSLKESFENNLEELNTVLNSLEKENETLEDLITSLKEYENSKPPTFIQDDPFLNEINPQIEDEELAQYEDSINLTIEKIKELNEQYKTINNEVFNILKEASNLLKDYNERLLLDPENFSEEDLNKFKSLNHVIQEGLTKKIERFELQLSTAFENLFILESYDILDDLKQLEKDIDNGGLESDPQIRNAYNSFLEDTDKFEKRLENLLRSSIILDHFIGQNLGIFSTLLSEDYLNSIPSSIREVILDIQEQRNVSPENQQVVVSFLYSEIISDPKKIKDLGARWSTEEGDVQFGDLFSVFKDMINMDKLGDFFSIADALANQIPLIADQSLNISEYISDENILMLLAGFNSVTSTPYFKDIVNNKSEDIPEEYKAKKELEANSAIIDDSLFFKDYLTNKKILKNHNNEIDKILKNMEKNVKPNSVIQEWKNLSREQKDEYLEKDFIDNYHNYNYINFTKENFEEALKNNDENVINSYDNLQNIDHMISSLITLINGLENKQFNSYMKGVHENSIQLLDYYQNVIRPQVVKNLENRKAFQEKSIVWNNITKWNNLGIKIDFDYQKQEYNYELGLIGEELKILLGEKEFEDFLKEGSIANFDMVFYEKFLSKIKSLPTDKLDVLNKKIEEQVKKNQDDSKQVFSQKTNSSIGMLDVSIKSSREYLSNPDYIFSILIDDILPRGYVKNKEYYNSPLFKFTQHKSLSELYFELQGYNNSEIGLDLDKYKEILEFHLQYSSLLELQKELKRDNKYLEYNEKLKKLVEKEGITLNRQQEISLYELYKWYTDGEQSISMLQGIAGTGKTTVILNYLLKILDIPGDKVIGTAHNTSATNTLYDVIDPATPTSGKSTLSDVLKDVTKLKDKNLLIIDEIFANDNVSIITLLEVIRAERKRRIDEKQLPLKVFMMGDPNQITNLKNFSIYGMLKSYALSKELNVISPLTVAYRSDVGSINSFSNVFQDRTFKVEGKQATHSKEINDNSALGVYAMKQGETKRDPKGLLEDIKTRIKTTKDNGRNEKVIIVSNPESAKLYQEFLDSEGITGIKIMNYIDVQGMTFDEVYIDILDKDITKKAEDEYSLNHHKNTIYYTALSRAKSYVMFYDESGTFFNNLDNSVTANNSSAIKEKQDLKEELQKLIDFRIAVLKGKTAEEAATLVTTPVTPPSTATPVTPTDSELVTDLPEDNDGTVDEDLTPAEEVEEEVAEQGITIDNEDDTSPESVLNNPPEGTSSTAIYSENTHTVNAPRAELMLPSATGNPARAQVGSNIVYVPISKRDGAVNRKGIAVYAQQSSTTGEPNKIDSYNILTIMYQDNLDLNNPFEKMMHDKLNDVKTFPNNKDFVSKKELYEKNVVLLEGKISYNQKLGFSYLSSGNITHKGEGLTTHLNQKILPFITKKTELDKTDGSATLYGTIQNAEYRVFTSKEIEKIAQDSNKLNKVSPLDINKDKGKPFYVVTISYPGTSNRTNTLYIRLNPSMMDINHTLFKPILSAKESVDYITKSLKAIFPDKNSTLGDNFFNEITTLFRRNYEVENGIIVKSKTPLITKTSNRDLVEKVFENSHNKVSMNSDVVDAIIDTFNSPAVDQLYKTMYSPKKQDKITSITGYNDFILDQIKKGNVTQEDAQEFLNVMDSYSKVDTKDDIELTIPGQNEKVPFRRNELNLLFRKKAGLSITDIFNYYSSRGIDIDTLPLPKDVQHQTNYKYEKFIGNGGYTAYRIKQLRYIIAKLSYVKITEGENKGKYYIFDPLTGQVKMTDKVHPKGYVSSSALKKDGQTVEPLKEETLSKSGSPLEKSLQSIVRNNEKIGEKVVRTHYSFVNKSGRVNQGISAPSILNYNTDNENSFDSALLGIIRKSWNAYVVNNRGNLKVDELKNLTYEHHESGAQMTMFYFPNPNLKNQKDENMLMLRKDLNLKNEEAFYALAQYMIDNNIPLVDGRKLTDDSFIQDIYSESSINKTKPVLTGEDLDILSQTENGQASNIRTPIDMFYLQKLNEKAKPGKESNRSVEEDTSLKELENLFETSFEKIYPTMVQIENKAEGKTKVEPVKPVENTPVSTAEIVAEAIQEEEKENIIINENENENEEKPPIVIPEPSLEEDIIERRRQEDLNRGELFLMNDGTYGGSRMVSLNEYSQIQTQENNLEGDITKWDYKDYNGTGIFVNVSTGQAYIVPNISYKGKKAEIVKVFINKSTKRFDLNNPRIINTPNIELVAKVANIDSKELYNEVLNAITKYDEEIKELESKTTASSSKEGVEELFESNPELANAVYSALGFEIPTTKLQGKQFEYGEPRFFDVVEELTSGERASLPSSILINKLLKGEYLPEIKESQIILGLSEAGIWRPNIKKIEASGENKSTLAKKIGHELLHSVTNNIILSYQNLKGTVDFTDKYYKDFIKQGYIKPVDLSKSQIEALDNLVRIRNKVISYVEQNKDKIQKQDRGFGTYDYFIRTNYTESETDLHEFISEVFTNPELINILKEIPTEGKKSNLFKDFVDAIAKILGFTNTSILEDIIAYSEEAFFTQPQITPQQKQQALQQYSQYLEQNPNGSIEGFKVWKAKYDAEPKTLEQPTSNELLEYIKDYNETYGQSIDSQNIKDELSLIKNEIEDFELQVDYGNVLNEKFFKRFFEDYGYNYSNDILILLEQNPDLFIKEYNNLKNESINNSEEEKTGNNEKTDCE